MVTIDARAGDAPGAELHVDVWGAGTPVILVHGSLATGAEEWDAQRPLADQGFRLLVPDRRGYGRSPAAEGEDFLRDADDIVALMGDGAHLVGHSYGGLGVLVAAARRPEATLSLTMLEPSAFALGQSDPAGRALVDAVRRAWERDRPDEEWVVGFLRAVGSDPDEFPPEFLAAALPLVPVVRNGRRPWYRELPLSALDSAPFPKLVVSGGHNPGFDAICDDLAERIGASRAVVAGAGHEIQFAGPPVNEQLLALWGAAGCRTRSTSGGQHGCSGLGGGRSPGSLLLPSADGGPPPAGRPRSGPGRYVVQRGRRGPIDLVRRQQHGGLNCIPLAATVMPTAAASRSPHASPCARVAPPSSSPPAASPAVPWSAVTSLLSSPWVDGPR